MQLRSVDIRNLRNIQRIATDFPQGSIFIHGKNGQGKTSVIEAIFLLSHARSFRTSSVRDIVNISDKKTNSESMVSGIIDTNLGTLHLAILIRQGKRELFINEKKVQTAADFCGRLKTVLFTPEDLELVKGAPLLRRQFLDRILVMLEPSIMNDLAEYTKLLKNRNALLLAGDFRKAKIFDSLLIEKNHTLVSKRYHLLQGIREKAKNLYFKIVHDKKEEMQLYYKSSFIKEGELISQEEARLIFESAFERDMKTGRTNIGIHRDEVLVKFTSEFVHGLSKIVSSQGQVRSVALCCKLASAEYIHEKTNEAPLLLLDDMDSELDDGRRESLYKLISEYPGQIFFTGTRLPVNSETSHIYSITSGILKNGRS